MTVRNGYLTRNSLATEIRKVVAKQHKMNPGDILINWITRWQLVKYPTGLIAKAAKIKLHATGFRSQVFIVGQIAHKNGL